MFLAGNKTYCTRKEKIVLWGNKMRESWIICIHEFKIYLCDKIHYPTGSYLFKVNKGNTRAMREICSKLKIKTPEQCQWRSSGFLISNFEHISLSISKCLLGTFRYNHIFLWLSPIRAAEIVEWVRKYMDKISQNLHSLSPYWPCFLQCFRSYWLWLNKSNHWAK